MGLPDQRELAFILLGVADLVLEQDGDGLAAPDGVFDCRHPGLARIEIDAVDERVQALFVAEPDVKLLGDRGVATRVAQEDVAGVGFAHGASLFSAARQSILSL